MRCSWILQPLCHCTKNIAIKANYKYLWLHSHSTAKVVLETGFSIRVYVHVCTRVEIGIITALFKLLFAQCKLICIYRFFLGVSAVFVKNTWRKENTHTHTGPKDAKPRRNEMNVDCVVRNALGSKIIIAKRIFDAMVCYFEWL